jgi:uncharacterized membrane protein YkvA (DUF1232 family)
MGTFERLKIWAKRIKRDGLTLWFASRKPGVPWHARAMAIFVVTYALSPIDLIPDFIPVLGYLDDLILLPGLIWLAIRMIPSPILAESRVQADIWISTKSTKPTSFAGAIVIIVIWISAGLALWHWVVKPWMAE